MKKKYINFFLLVIGCLILFGESEGTSVFPWDIPEISQKKEPRRDLFIPGSTSALAQTDQKVKEEIEKDSWLLDDTDFLAFCLGYYDPFCSEGMPQSLEVIYAVSGFDFSLQNDQKGIEEERFEYLSESFTYSQDSEPLDANKQESQGNLSLANEIQIFEKEDVSNFLLTQSLFNESFEISISQDEGDKQEKKDVQDVDLVKKSDKPASSSRENSFTDCSAMFMSDSEREDVEKNKLNIFEEKDFANSLEEKENKEEEISLFKESESNPEGEMSKRKIDFEDLEPEIIETVSLSLGPQQHKNTKSFFYTIAQDDSTEDLAFFEASIQGIVDSDEPLFIGVAQKEIIKIKSFLPLSEIFAKWNQFKHSLNIYIPELREALKVDALTAHSEQSETKDIPSDADLSLLEEGSLKIEEIEDFFGSDNQEESPLIESLFRKSEKPEPPKAPPVLDKLAPSLWEKNQESEEVKIEVYRAEGL